MIAASIWRHRQSPAQQAILAIKNPSKTAKTRQRRRACSYPCDEWQTTGMTNFSTQHRPSIMYG
ncbi:hypothetical protein CSC3H3_20430 [Thalassospira marina]|uniref:Uncharacterized protein n=1 Tax=Thalassospira marina TaxID=2048283 RepID=A0ABN5FJH6_9PROT|nr:hypothetical protein CSC3H3_20430 [Thalassospira marina]